MYKILADNREFRDVKHLIAYLIADARVSHLSRETITQLNSMRPGDRIVIFPKEITFHEVKDREMYFDEVTYQTLRTLCKGFLSIEHESDWERCDLEAMVETAQEILNILCPKIQVERNP